MDETIGLADKNQNTKNKGRHSIEKSEWEKRFRIIGGTIVPLAITAGLFMITNPRVGADAPKRQTSTTETAQGGMETFSKSNEIDPTRQLELLQRATVSIESRQAGSNNKWHKQGKGAVVMIHTSNGTEMISLKAGAHEFDLKREKTVDGKDKITTPIRAMLKNEGNGTAADILPYVRKVNEYRILVPRKAGLNMHDIAGIRVSTRADEDEDLAIIMLKEGPKVDALRDIALAPNYQQPLSGDKIILGMGPDGEPLSGTWMGEAVVFNTGQQSGFIDVPAEISERECGNGQSGRVFMTKDGVAPGTLYSLLRGSDPGDADKIANIMQATEYELPAGHNVCHLINNDFRIPGLAG